MNNKKISTKDRKRIAQKFIKRARKDISYLLKPRPRFLPFAVWITILAYFLKLDNKSLKDICLISSSKTSKKK
jgi:hypothetical protein